MNAESGMAMRMALLTSAMRLLVACILLLSFPMGTLAFFQTDCAFGRTRASLSKRPQLERRGALARRRATQLADNAGMDAYEAQMRALQRPTGASSNMDAPKPSSSTETLTPRDNNNAGTTSFGRTSGGPTAGTMDGIDAYEAQLRALQEQAASSNGDATPQPSATVTVKPRDGTSTVGTSSTSRDSIGGLLFQRAIQTQLYYLADLKDEPTYVWLREFLGHDHLDDRGHFNQLDGLHCSGGWRGYLQQLEQAPPFTIVVQLAPPRLSAQQRRNPYLAQQANVGKSYEETIQPSAISGTLRTVARSLENEWGPVLTDLAAADRTRAYLSELDFSKLYSTEAAQQFAASQQVVAGGEGDDQETPLHSLNCRMVTRFCTRLALRRIVEELQGLSLPTTGESDKEASAAADEAAVQYMRAFSREWVPRLERGVDDEKRRVLGKAPPGQFVRLCDGADADDVTEALWQELPPVFCDVSDDAMCLYSPEALAARLRRVRADVCDELVEELRDAVLSIS